MLRFHVLSEVAQSPSVVNHRLTSFENVEHCISLIVLFSSLSTPNSDDYVVASNVLNSQTADLAVPGVTAAVPTGKLDRVAFSVLSLLNVIRMSQTRSMGAHGIGFDKEMSQIITKRLLTAFGFTSQEMDTEALNLRTNKYCRLNILLTLLSTLNEVRVPPHIAPKVPPSNLPGTPGTVSMPLKWTVLSDFDGLDSQFQLSVGLLGYYLSLNGASVEIETSTFDVGLFGRRALVNSEVSFRIQSHQSMTLNVEELTHFGFTNVSDILNSSQNVPLRIVDSQFEGLMDGEVVEGETSIVASHPNGHNDDGFGTSEMSQNHRFGVSLVELDVSLLANTDVKLTTTQNALNTPPEIAENGNITIIYPPGDPHDPSSPSPTSSRPPKTGHLGHLWGHLRLFGTLVKHFSEPYLTRNPDSLRTKTGLGLLCVTTLLVSLVGYSMREMGQYWSYWLSVRAIQPSLGVGINTSIEEGNFRHPLALGGLGVLTDDEYGGLQTASSVLLQHFINAVGVDKAGNIFKLDSEAESLLDSNFSGFSDRSLLVRSPFLRNAGRLWDTVASSMSLMVSGLGPELEHPPTMSLPPIEAFGYNDDEYDSESHNQPPITPEDNKSPIGADLYNHYAKIVSYVLNGESAIEEYYKTTPGGATHSSTTPNRTSVDIEAELTKSKEYISNFFVSKRDGFEKGGEAMGGYFSNFGPAPKQEAPQKDTKRKLSSYDDILTPNYHFFLGDDDEYIRVGVNDIFHLREHQLQSLPDKPEPLNRLGDTLFFTPNDVPKPAPAPAQRRPSFHPFVNTIINGINTRTSQSILMDVVHNGGKLFSYIGGVGRCYRDTKVKLDLSNQNTEYPKWDFRDVKIRKSDVDNSIWANSIQTVPKNKPKMSQKGPEKSFLGHQEANLSPFESTEVPIDTTEDPFENSSEHLYYSDTFLSAISTMVAFTQTVDYFIKNPLYWVSLDAFRSDDMTNSFWAPIGIQLVPRIMPLVCCAGSDPSDFGLGKAGSCQRAFKWFKEWPTLPQFEVWKSYSDPHHIPHDPHFEGEAQRLLETQRPAVLRTARSVRHLTRGVPKLPKMSQNDEKMSQTPPQIGIKFNFEDLSDPVEDSVGENFLSPKADNVLKRSLQERTGDEETQDISEIDLVTEFVEWVSAELAGIWSAVDGVGDFEMGTEDSETTSEPSFLSPPPLLVESVDVLFKDTPPSLIDDVPSNRPMTPGYPPTMRQMEEFRSSILSIPVFDVLIKRAKSIDSNLRLCAEQRPTDTVMDVGGSTLGGLWTNAHSCALVVNLLDTSINVATTTQEVWFAKGTIHCASVLILMALSISTLHRFFVKEGGDIQSDMLVLDAERRSLYRDEHAYDSVPIPVGATIRRLLALSTVFGATLAEFTTSIVTGFLAVTVLYIAIGTAQGRPEATNIRDTDLASVVLFTTAVWGVAALHFALTAFVKLTISFLFSLKSLKILFRSPYSSDVVVYDRRRRGMVSPAAISEVVKASSNDFIIDYKVTTPLPCTLATGDPFKVIRAHTTVSVIRFLFVLLFIPILTCFAIVGEYIKYVPGVKYLYWLSSFAIGKDLLISLITNLHSVNWLAWVLIGQALIFKLGHALLLRNKI